MNIPPIGWICIAASVMFLSIAWEQQAKTKTIMCFEDGSCKPMTQQEINNWKQ